MVLSATAVSGTNSDENPSPWTMIAVMTVRALVSSVYCAIR